MLVVELRHASEHHLDRCWVLQLSEPSINENYAYIADFVIGEARKNKAFDPFDDKAFLWLYGRCTATRKPSRSCTRQRLRMSAMVTLQTHRSIPRAKLSTTARWSAASLVPRWRPRACRNRVFRAVSRPEQMPWCSRVYDRRQREALSLSTHVSLQPA